MINRKNTYGVIIKLVLLSIILNNTSCIFLPFKIRYSKLISDGNKIINELDKYYSINKKYPEETDRETLNTIYREAFSDSSFNIIESTQPYYYKKGGQYMLIYHFGFDPPDLFYYSNIKEWQYR